MFVTNLNTIDKIKNKEDLKSYLIGISKKDYDIVFEEDNKIVLSIYSSVILNMCVRYEHNLDFLVKELLKGDIRNTITSENFLNTKGINKIILMCFDFNQTKSNKEALSIAILERNPIGIDKKTYYKIAVENQISNRIGLKFLERKFNKIYDTDLFEIDNKKIIEDINNAYKQGEKLKRNHKLQLLIKYSIKDEPIYETYEYLSELFELSKAQNLWLNLYKQFWNEKIKNTNSDRKLLYFQNMEKYFKEHEEFENYFNELKMEYFQEKVNLF